MVSGPVETHLWNYGIVTFNDNAKYTSYWSSEPFPLTADQYTAILNFANTSGYGQYNTGPYSYIVSGQNCIRFSWDSAKQGGIGLNIIAINGTLRPMDNIPLIQAAYKERMATYSWTEGKSWSDITKSQDTNNRPPTNSDTQTGNTQLVIPVTVQQGDSLDKTIANAFNSNGKDIADATSKLNGSYTCSERTVVNVPVRTDANGNISYIAQEGDNWDLISARTGVPIETLWANNKKLADQGIFSAEEPIRYKVKDITTSGTVVKTSTNQNSAAASQNSIVDFNSATFVQKWQYNFQTILGPSNPAFIDGQPIDGYRLDYNPNGVLWNVNAAGTPHPYGYRNLLEQNRVINTATQQTITELQGSGDFPVTSSDLA